MGNAGGYIVANAGRWRLTAEFLVSAKGFALAFVSLIALLLFTLGLELAFRGYLFARLIRLVGPTTATLVMSVLYASVSAFHPQWTRLSVLNTFLLGLLFSLAYLRTHALWLGWGIHFAWASSMAVLFGLPIGGVEAYSAVVDTAVQGSNWITGGLYGPEGAVSTMFIVIAGCCVLYRLTREYAWLYTHPPIVAGGYPVEVAAPASHVAQEAITAARPAPLVQILSSTPTAPSTLPVIEQHLRSEVETDSTF